MAVIEMNWRPSNSDLRVFAGVQLVVATIGAWLLHRRLGWDAVAIGLVALSFCSLIVGLVRPTLLRTLFVAWMLAAFPLGWLVSHLVMALVYYGVVTPIGIALRMRGRDSLGLKPNGHVDTYWHPRPPAPESAKYFRQF